MKAQGSVPEVERLEGLWSGQFGNEYVDRNRTAGVVRGPFWTSVLRDLKPATVLEVGCNVGANLQWIAPEIGPERTYGLDINLAALEEIRRNLGRVNTVWSPAREIPFRDRYFDLVFTMGVLIHQPESTLPLVMSEIVRCSRRFVLCGEYYAETLVEVSYRQQTRALFKRDYGRIYRELFPELRLIREGFLGKDVGWDDVTYWIFQKD